MLLVCLDLKNLRYLIYTYTHLLAWQLLLTIAFLMWARKGAFKKRIQRRNSERNPYNNITALVQFCQCCVQRAFPAK